MKIICSTCKKELGVQRPFNDNSKVSAKCPECFRKEKEEALKPQALPLPGERKDITFENGLKGYLTVAEVDTPFLTAWDLYISGKKFFCKPDSRESLQEYLEMIEKDQVDVTFLHSSSIPIPPSDRRRKKQPIKPDEEKSKTIHYNATMSVPKDQALMMFDNVAGRAEEFVKFLADAIIKADMVDRQKALNKDNPKDMSTS